MKQIHFPIHKIIGVMLLIGAWYFAQSRFAAQTAIDHSWALDFTSYKFCRLAIYGMVGASLALLSTDAQTVGFRLHFLPLTFAAMLLFYALIDNFGTAISMNINGQYDHFPQWIGDFSHWVYIHINPIFRAGERLHRHFSGSTSYTQFLPALQHILDLLTGFCLVRGIFGSKEE